MKTRSPLLAGDVKSRHVKFPKDLLQRLNLSAREATPRRTGEEEIVTRLEQSFQPSTRLPDLLLEGLGLHKYQRIPSTTEEGDLRRLFLFLEHIHIDGIFLAARKDAVYGAVLIVLIQSGALTLFMDGSSLNTATEQSKSLVMDLFATIEKLNYFEKLRIADGYAADTRDVSAFEAIDCYLTGVPFYPEAPIQPLIDRLSIPITPHHD